MEVNVNNLGGNKLGGLPGMPGGFAFAMVLLGIALGIAGAVFGGIREYFFEIFGKTTLAVGLALIQWGAILQGVLWICSAFRRSPPTA